MANVAETSTWTAGVYQLETTDPVQGGAAGIANQQAKDLASRTVWLKDHLAAVAIDQTWTTVTVTGTTTWTCPAGVTKVLILEQVGAGGGGAGGYTDGAQTASGGGGGEGARVEGLWLTVVPTTVYTLTIGAAGAAGASVSHTFSVTGQDAATFGGDGGDTSFGALLVTPGGQGAGDSANTWNKDYVTIPGTGGSVTVGGVVFKGAPGWFGSSPASSDFSSVRGGGRLGADFMVQRTGASSTVQTHITAGYGCGGAGGRAGGLAPSAGGAGLIRFCYQTIAVSGNT